MALVEFVNDSAPYLNAQNLNNNFNELQNSIPTKTSDLTNDLQFAQSISITLENLDEFRAYCINSAPNGVTLYNFWTSGGSSSGIILQKANNNYLSFIIFSYATNATQHKYALGTWTTVQLG